MKENVDPLLDRAKNPQTKEVEKLEILSACFALNFTGKVCFQTSQVSVASHKVGTGVCMKGLN